MTTRSHVALATFLQRQFGTVTTAQAGSVGVPRRTIARMAERGELHRLYDGVYASALYPDTWQLRWMSKLLACGDHVALSRRAAAHVWGLAHTGTGRRPDVELVTSRAGRSLRGIDVRTQVHLRPDDVTRHGPWRVTTVAWTLASLTHELGLSRTERAVSAAISRAQLTIADLADCVPRFRHCPGVEALRLILTRLSPELRLTSSAAEALAFRLVVGAGLPPPEVNLRVVDRSGRVRRLDLAWPQWGVCVEIDLHPDHQGTIGRHHDGRRQNDLVLDWTVLRFDDLDLQFDPGHVIEVVTRALRAAGAPV